MVCCRHSLQAKIVVIPSTKAIDVKNNFVNLEGCNYVINFYIQLY